MAQALALGGMIGNATGLNPDGLSLDLNFAVDKSFSKPSTLAAAETQVTSRKGPSPVFSRGSGATMVGSDGLIQYGPENLINFSESFATTGGTNNNWATNANLAIDSSNNISPTGSANAVQFRKTSTLAATLTASASVGSSENRISSFYAKSISGSSQIQVSQNNGSTFSVFNITSDWVRYSLNATIEDHRIQFRFVTNGDIVQIWGVQLERASVARQYIPTTTSRVFGPRFDHDPVTLATKGLLIEEARTNLVFPSDALATQTVTVTAVAHTISFYGTGTVVLSGVTGPTTVTGTGVYPTRTILTFTPTAGSLVITVTGSVVFAQLEVGAFATSYIPTITTALARSADVCLITGSAFTSFYNQAEGSLLCASTRSSTNSNAFIVQASDGTFNNGIDLRYASLTSAQSIVNVSNVNQVLAFTFSITASALIKQAIGYKINDCAYSVNSGTALTDTSATLPTNNRLSIGSATTGGSQYANGTISSIRYYNKRLSNAKIQTLTA